MTNDRCISCKHYLGDLTCVAFDRIPNEILLGEDDHSKPRQDGDFFYEPIKSIETINVTP